MTEKHQQPAAPEDAGTGLAPGDLDDVLGGLDDGPETDDGGRAGEPDGTGEPEPAAGGTGADPADGEAPAAAPEGGGSDRQRLADFARGFDAGGTADEDEDEDEDQDEADEDDDADPADARERSRTEGGTTDDATEGRAPEDVSSDAAPARGTRSGSDDETDRRPSSGPSSSDAPDDAGSDARSADDDQPSRAPKDGATGSSADERPARTGSTLNPGEVYRIVDGKEQRDTAWTRLVARTKGLFTGSPAQEEERLDHDLEDLRLRGLSQGVTLALGSIKGGAGKTTITLTLAEVLANALRVGVLVVDADLEFGTASDSVPDAARHGGTLVDVHRKRHEIQTPGDLAPYLVTLPHGAQLLSGPTDPNDIEKIDTDTMTELMELLRRFYPIILVDLPPGMGLRGSIPRWGFAEADDIVLVTTPKRANVKQMGHMLDYVSERHEGVPLTLAINMVPSRLDEAGQRVVGVAQSNGRSRRTAEIPEDPVLSRQLDAGALDIAGLDQRTRIAVKDLTYALASQWCR